MSRGPHYRTSRCLMWPALISKLIETYINLGCKREIDSSVCKKLPSINDVNLKVALPEKRLDSPVIDYIHIKFALQETLSLLFTIKAKFANEGSPIVNFAVSPCWLILFEHNSQLKRSLEKWKVLCKGSSPHIHSTEGECLFQWFYIQIKNIYSLEMGW